jgi:hypothetical protein
MFSNLSRGSILNGIDRRGEMKWFTGTIERVTPSINNQYPNAFGQFPSLNIDIVVNINGEQKEFKGIHSNDFIADFGEGSFILADNKESLYNYVKSLLKTSEEATNEEVINKHRKKIPQYKRVLEDMIPGTSNPTEVKELKEQVGILQTQLAEALNLLKSGTKPKE